MRAIHRVLGPLLAGLVGLTLSAQPAPTPPEKTSGWVFELLPKSFQKNPRAAFTVITEMTASGRTLPPVTPEAPVYYVAQSAGYKAAGDIVDEDRVGEAEIERALASALATKGFLPATGEHPASLVLVYVWGSHNLPDDDNGMVSSGQLARNLLERAALAGGDTFARELGKAFAASDLASTASAQPMAVQANSGAEGMIVGAAAGLGQMSAMLDPVRLFRNSSPKNAQLLDHTAEDCYFVIASAYDYSSVAAGAKKLLWRTRMTVSSQGISQATSLPTLIATAGPHFGEDMTEAELVTKRLIRDGKVEIGTAKPVP